MMTIVDDRGRLLGRFNLIDAAIAIVLLSLIPVGYTAYWLFRAPVPEVTAVEPTVLQQGKESSVRLQGRYLRPYLRAYAGTTAGTFLLENSTRAELKLPALSPGAYDLVLYDESHEVGRRPNALTVKAIRSRVTAYGAFTGLGEERVQDLRRNFEAGNLTPVTWAHVLEAYPPQPDVGDGFRLPAAMEIECTATTAGCNVGAIALAPKSVLEIPFSTGPVNFQIQALFTSVLKPVEVLVELVGPQAVRAFAKAGDIDGRGPASGPRFQATLLAVNRADRSDTPTARFRVPVVDTPAGWDYNGLSIKVGKSFSFETLRYFLQGAIVDIRTSDAADGQP